MSGHTPGPWEMSGNVPHVEIHDGDDTICWLELSHLPQDAANARLIAAAPCLLEALVGLVNISDSYTGDPDEDAATWVSAYDKACAAIHKATAKATGGES